MEGLAVFTLNPRAHALFADKRNLVLLSDGRALERIGVDPAGRTLLQGTPQHRPVQSETRASGVEVLPGGLR